MEKNEIFKDWDGVRELARILANSKEKGEAAWRSAINRAYFAAYHKGICFSEGYLGYVRTFTNDHGFEYSHKGGLGFHKPLKLVAATIHRLGAKRNEADYHPERIITRDDAIFQVGECDFVFNEINKEILAMNTKGIPSDSKYI